MTFDCDNIKKFENVLIKIWFSDVLNRKHCSVGNIDAINETYILFNVNNEDEIIPIQFSRIRYIMFK